MVKDNKTVKPGFKVVAIVGSALLVAAMAATGVLAYAQNNTGSNTTALQEQLNATSAATLNSNETASSSGAAPQDDSDQADETTSTASAAVDSECTPVITTEDGVALNGATSLTGRTLDEDALQTMTAGLNDTQFSSLDELIENACDAVRDGKSVTALGFLSAARDILNDASEIETAEAQGGDEVADEDEPGDVDAASDVEDNDESGED